MDSTLPTMMPSHNLKIHRENEELENSQEQHKPMFADLQKSRLNDIDKMYNPWLSKNHHHSQDEELLEMPSEDFVVKSIASTGCSIRAFKNASVYSSSEFIHEYIDYKKCTKEAKGG